MRLAGSAELASADQPKGPRISSFTIRWRRVQMLAPIKS
jgi:hypothetical protein